KIQSCNTVPVLYTIEKERGKYGNNLYYKLFTCNSGDRPSSECESGQKGELVSGVLALTVQRLRNMLVNLLLLPLPTVQQITSLWFRRRNDRICFRLTISNKRRVHHQGIHNSTTKQVHIERPCLLFQDLKGCFCIAWAKELPTPLPASGSSGILRSCIGEDSMRSLVIDVTEDSSSLPFGLRGFSIPLNTPLMDRNGWLTLSLSVNMMETSDICQAMVTIIMTERRQCVIKFCLFTYLSSFAIFSSSSSSSNLGTFLLTLVATSSPMESNLEIARKANPSVLASGSVSNLSNC
ncbi:hypothetical protein Ccrd_000035, partial [Cynara cardunculus var. scolymus]